MASVFFLYWFVTKTLRQQNVLLLVASYVFYGAWDWRFLLLLAFSTFLDYFTGLQIHRSQTKGGRKTWLLISIVVNLGFLGFFKYYNFFVESFASMLGQVGMSANFTTLNLILPVGISFYTFHGLSYVFDIYNKKIEPTTNFTDYSLFVSFFPLLVAGPIERATHLLPQIKKERTFEYTKAVDGLRQILWGLFKKIVIADNCAVYANEIFTSSADYSGTTLWLGAVFFAFQIYGDFSGYSDIALGTARLFGIELLRNFAFPYFSRDIAEFWRRWHISLSSWFRDYLYIPLGGNKGSTLKKVRNVFIIFLVSGFWHGASLTFIAWGFLNAVYILPSVLFKTNRKNLDIVAQGRRWPSLNEFVHIIITFGLTVIAWVFFRAMGLRHAIQYVTSMFKGLFNTNPYQQTMQYIHNKVGYVIPVLIILFILVEWIGREQRYALENLELKYPSVARWGFYYAVVVAIFFYAGAGQQFIYFQF
ncbi:MAG TPA: MBOAT family O-acyltransferase [Flavisolibacter sp.]|nr:MBOAT family O-acyltransferase [Flavisolibacter sp.]